jgi:hypothetical protein
MREDVVVIEQFPPPLADQIAGFPEVHMGVNRVTVELRDGTAVSGVLVGGQGEIVRVEGHDTLPFVVSDVIAVHDESGLA